VLTTSQFLVLVGLLFETVAVLLSFSKLFGLWEYPTVPQRKRIDKFLLALFGVGMFFQILAVFWPT